MPVAKESHVILNFGPGSGETGFPAITVQVWLAGSASPAQITGSLPGAPQLVEDWQRWQQLYRALNASPTGGISQRSANEFEADWAETGGLEAGGLEASGFEIEDDDVTNLSLADFTWLSDRIVQQLNGWLDGPGFLPIERYLRTELSPSEPLRLMLMAKDKRLLRLPWCRWRLLDDYPKAEIALSPPDFKRSIKAPAPVERGVSILVVLGYQDGLDLTVDLQHLKALPHARLHSLVEPSWEALNQCLWSNRWDIFFFAGHSSSEAKGHIQLNAGEQISIEQLRYALQKAIERGLQLAILNSCDGLKLAWDLVALNLPQVVAMGEPVADPVAQAFLKHFLAAFSQGQTLYCAVREARAKLQPLEMRHPAASWLPVIVQNPAEQPPSWRSLARGGQTGLGHPATGANAAANATVMRSSPTNLSSNPSPSPSLEPNPHSSPDFSASVPKPMPSETTLESVVLPPPVQPHRQPQSSPRSQTWASPALTALIMTVAVLAIRWLGLLMPLEQWAFDQLMRSRPSEGPDPRLLIVTIDDEDLQWQAGRERDISLTDDSLSQLLAKLSAAQVIGLDLYRDFAVTNPNSKLAQQLQDPRLIGVCKGTDPTVASSGISPPPEIPLNNLGYSDFVKDTDGVLRRQTMFMDPLLGAPCQARYAFATQLVLNYFLQEKTPVNFSAERNLIIGEQEFHQLNSHQGGYQGIDARGSQILIHYRALDQTEAIAQKISLRQVLASEFQPESLQGRIVLIGSTASVSKDFWETPYGSNPFQQLSGVEVHAHIASQMLSAVLNDRPLLWTLPPVIEGFWIFVWSGVGGAAVILFRDDLKSVIGSSSTCVILLTAASFAIMLRGGWMPLVPAAISLCATATAALVVRQSLSKPPP